MRLVGASRLLAAGTAWWFAAGCGLNPQPEPPSDTAERGNDAGTSFNGGSGGSSSSAGGGTPVIANGGSIGAGAMYGAGGAGQGAGGASSGTGATTGAGGALGTGGSMATGGTTSTGGSQDAAVTEDAAGDAPDDGATYADCTSGGSSTLPGVSIRFPSQPCTFSIAEVTAGVTFHYEIVVEASVTILASPQDWGGCGSPMPGGLPVLETISGSSQSYCVCDTGLCFSEPPAPVVLTPGVYAGTFFWDGVNWIGPSDFGNPKGAVFPPGTYTLSVHGSGGLPGEAGVDAGADYYEVLGTLGITLTP